MLSNGTSVAYTFPRKEVTGFNSACEPLRVALVAGTLGQGGAEKQLLYIARALRDANVEVKVFSLTQAEFYESLLTEIGLQPTWVGRRQHPMSRLVTLSGAVRQFRPHILQSIHFFTNLYTAIIARQHGAVGIGSIRGDTLSSLKANAFWGKWLLQMPHSLIVNSYCAKATAEASGVRAEKVHVLPNVLNLTDFDSRFDSATLPQNDPGSTTVMAIGRLIPGKRFERFITAIAEGRRRGEPLKGILVGDGPERGKLESIARTHGLQDHLSFLGRRDDVVALLKQASMLVLCSDNEGFPNVLLEAMAARLPVITTPAGDAGSVVHDGITGYVVPFDDPQMLVDRMVALGKSRDLRVRMGEAGRQRLEDHYTFESLAPRLLSIYRDIAVQQNHRALLSQFQ